MTAEQNPFPPAPSPDDWKAFKRYANVCVLAQTFLYDDAEFSKMLGGTLGALTPEEAWKRAEAFYDREISNDDH